MQRLEWVQNEKRISYLKGGTGNRALVCLHGFGEESSDFTFLEEGLSASFTLYAVDLPWHGKTNWNNELTFDIQDMIAFLEDIIPSFHQQQICLLGFSMGGRVGLSLIQELPEKIAAAVLLAPDGLQLNPWYWLSTQTFFGNRLFYYTMQHPKWLASFINMLNRAQLVNSSIAKYVHRYIDEKRVRTDLYHIWTTMRRFRPNLKLIKRHLAHHNISVHLVFGKYDRIIPVKNGWNFQKGIAHRVHVYELPAGHQLLKEKHAAFIISLLTNE